MSMNQYTADEALVDVDNVLEHFLAPVGISKADALDRIIQIVNRYLVLRPQAAENVAVAHPASWERTRHFLSIAISAFSLPGRPGGQSIEAAANVLDALTVSGSPLAHLREAAPHQLVALTPAAHRALAERRRQIDAEGFTPEHDDEHEVGRLICAAICYAGADTTNYPAGEPPDMWPCAPEWWKPGDDSRNLDKATALLLAASEQLDRAAAATGAPASV